MTATLQETPAQARARASNRARQARYRDGHGRQGTAGKPTALVIEQHQRMLAHIEEFVFLVTVHGMDQLGAIARLGYTEHTMDRWLTLIEEHPALGYWHACPRDPDTGQWLLPSVLDCPRNHETAGTR